MCRTRTTPSELLLIETFYSRSLSVPHRAIETLFKFAVPTADRDQRYESRIYRKLKRGKRKIHT